MKSLSERRATLQALLAAVDAEETQQLKRLVPGSGLPRWTIVGKHEVSAPSQNRQGGPTIPGARLILICERNGRRREAVVGNETWNIAKVGDEIGLREDMSLPRSVS
jgi:hypothetical protein